MKVLANIDHARAINVNGNHNLAKYAEKYGCKYFFMSSVEVFGREIEGLKETTETSPINEYGRQKEEAEIHLLESNDKNIIIGRTSWNISMNGIGRCLIDVMIDSLEKPDSKMAEDNLFTIASSYETAGNIIKALESNFTGIVHIASPTPISRYKIAKIIMKLSRSKMLSCKKCKFNDLSFKEPRSRLNVLDSSLSILTFNASYSDPTKIIIDRLINLNIV